MENAIYTAAVLGSLCDDNANAPNVVAKVVGKLVAIDQQLVELTKEENPPVDSSDTVSSLLSLAAEEVSRLVLSHGVSVCYNDTLAQGVKGRLRLEIEGTCWDADAPLYLS